MLVGEVYEGDYLIAHTGYAIEKLDIEEAKERLKLWEEYLAYLKLETQPSQAQ
jgi:hydrogenase expression/formation protein HypC